LIHPGDAVIADDDGVLRVAREDVATALAASRARAAKEEVTRAALAAGELGLDRYGLRADLERLGVEYVSYTDHAREAPQPRR
jgi:4-hydroxy-4-methyl-2-oxoglutarate aldolase